MSPKITYEKLSNGEHEEFGSLISPLSPSTRKRSVVNLMLILCVLVVSNTITWVLSTRASTGDHRKIFLDLPTPYAGLEKNQSGVIAGHDAYTDRNETFRDEMWLNMHSDDGIIALDDEYVDKMGLPVSQRFPWDQKKGIYLLHGFHNLHCTRSIYISLMEYRKGVPQTRNHHHIIHCLDALRRDVLCNADDTPRYTTPDSSPETGNGQPRMCRSWDKMHDWAKQHNACYRYIHEQSSNYPEIQRFVWCPEGSPYRKEVDKYFIVDYDTPRASGID